MDSEEEHFHSPQLPDSPSMLNPGTPEGELWSEESDDARFSDSDAEVIDLTREPVPKKRLLTDFFLPVTAKSNKMPYFLQVYRPRPPAPPYAWCL